MIFWHSLENDLTVTHTINIDTIQIFQFYLNIGPKCEVSVNIDIAMVKDHFHPQESDWTYFLFDHVKIEMTRNWGILARTFMWKQAHYHLFFHEEMNMYLRNIGFFPQNCTPNVRSFQKSDPSYVLKMLLNFTHTIVLFWVSQVPNT